MRSRGNKPHLNHHKISKPQNGSITQNTTNVNGSCKGCNVKGPFYGGYRCNEPTSAGLFFHKECAEAPPEITNHPSHPQHPLKLHNSLRKPCKCNICGKTFFAFGYRCSSKCDFTVDLTCGINPLPLAIEHPKSHHHPVVFLKEPAKPGRRKCGICKGYNGGCSYACIECEVHFHVECVNFSQEVNHPSHPQHSLELLGYESLTSDAEKTVFYVENDQTRCFIAARYATSAYADFVQKIHHPLLSSIIRRTSIDLSSYQDSSHLNVMHVGCKVIEVLTCVFNAGLLFIELVLTYHVS